MRILMLAVLVLAFGRASGVFWFGDACSDRCADDCADGKQCPPGCPGCACAAAPQTMPAAKFTIATPARAVHSVVFVAPPQFVPSPDPSEILHVPRLAA